MVQTFSKIVNGEYGSLSGSLSGSRIMAALKECFNTVVLLNALIIKSGL